ncbi:MAG: hypothetical protein R2699_08905 [Acidimicrobiales bacterium]
MTIIDDRIRRAVGLPTSTLTRYSASVGSSNGSRNCTAIVGLSSELPVTL